MHAPDAAAKQHPVRENPFVLVIVSLHCRSDEEDIMWLSDLCRREVQEISGFEFHCSPNMLYRDLPPTVSPTTSLRRRSTTQEQNVSYYHHHRFPLLPPLRKKKRSAASSLVNIILAFLVTIGFVGLSARAFHKKLHRLRRHRPLLTTTVVPPPVDTKQQERESSSTSTRASRFPSIDERVRLYMGEWYMPPCPHENTLHYNSPDSDVETTYFLQWRRATNESKGHRAFSFGKDATVWEAQPLYKEEAKENSFLLNYIHPSFLQPVSNSNSDDDIRQLWSSFATASTSRWWFRRPVHLPPPLLVDVKTGHLPGLALPIWAGYRPASFRRKSDIYEATVSSCRRPTGQDPPRILWKISKQNTPMLSNVTVWDIPYEEKDDRAIFRGRPTASTHATTSEMTGASIDQCLAVPECQFVWTHSQSRLVDARLVGHRRGGLPAGIALPNSKRNEMVELFAGHDASLATMLRYKIIVLLQSQHKEALPWALYSNSVVLLEYPVAVTSWNMEERMRPWVHYVPFHNASSTTDGVQARVQWILSNPVAAQRIARNGMQWMTDLLAHPDAAMDDAYIQAEMMRRYSSHFTWDHRLL